VTVVQSARHDQHLDIGRHQANQFVITLKEKKKADPTIKTMIETEREKIVTQGFPNCFGIQRFGPGNKNYHKATALLKQAENIPDSQYVLRFIVQAYPSMLFNHYAMQRWRKNQNLIDGDIVVTDPTPRRKDYAVYEDGVIRSCNYTVSKKNCRGQLIGSCESVL
jgi:tRNA pseudouridine13 synthase